MGEYKGGGSGLGDGWWMVVDGDGWWMVDGGRGRGSMERRLK